MLLACCILASAVGLPAAGQQYSITWYKIAGGGGTSTNGPYSLSGTIGQPDTGAMSGGNYSLTGGFWSLIAVVQTPGAPALAVTHSGNSVTISWPCPSLGFVLQQHPAVDGANWTDATNTLNVSNGQNQVTVSPALGNRLFRLVRPQTN
jgi:hypothetical protein